MFTNIIVFFFVFPGALYRAVPEEEFESVTKSEVSADSHLAAAEILEKALNKLTN